MATFEGLESFEEENLHKVLVSLLDNKDVVTKTEIQNPLNMARLVSIAEWLEAYNMTKPANFLREFIKMYLTYMISHDRKSRGEVVAVLGEGMKEERRLRQKLTSNMEE